MTAMGYMDMPRSVWVDRFGTVLKVEAFLFMTFWALAYTMKFGMVWHPGLGAPMMPPYFKIEGPSAWLFNMILGVYCILGIYMWKASNDPQKNKHFIGFWIWGGVFIHMVMMVLTVRMMILTVPPGFVKTNSSTSHRHVPRPCRAGHLRRHARLRWHRGRLRHYHARARLWHRSLAQCQPYRRHPAHVHVLGR